VHYHVTRALFMTPSWAVLFSSLSRIFSISSTLVLFPYIHRPSKWSLPSGLRTKRSYASPIFTMHVLCPAHIFVLELNSPIIRGKYKSGAPHYTVLSFLLPLPLTEIQLFSSGYVFSHCQSIFVSKDERSLKPIQNNISHPQT
jgi:hypothetical protein